MKKALAFIKEKAEVKPKTTRTGNIFVIPEEIVEEIKTQIEEHDGSFAIPAKAFNVLFGWDSKYNKNYYLKNKLNNQYPLDGELEWHVGCIEKGTLYCFEIREAKEVKTGEDN